MNLNAVELAKRRARERLLRSEGRHPSGFSSTRTQQTTTKIAPGPKDLHDIREAFQETSTRLRLRSGRGKENAYRQRKQDEQMVGGNDLLGPTCSFFFQQRKGSLDLKAIARVDIEKLIKEVDVETIQAYLENIAFAEVTEADMRQYTDDAFLRLFRLAQLTIEYLLNVQHTLYTHVAALEKELQSIKDEQSYADKKIVQQDEQLKALKSEVHQKKRTMKTYELLLQQQAAQRKPDLQEPMESTESTTTTSVAVNTEAVKEQTSNAASYNVAPIKAQLEEAKAAIRAEVENQQARLRENDRAFLEETVQQLETKLQQMSSRLEETERKAQVTLAGSILDDDETATSQIQVSAETTHMSSAEHQKEDEISEKGDEEKEKESLMQRLARSKVSPALASARSMQLRRVLRLVRRKIHEKTFKQWYFFTLSAKMEIEAHERVLMERVKLQQRSQGPLNETEKTHASDPDVDRILERYRMTLELTPAPNKHHKTLNRTPDLAQDVLPREEALKQVEEELYSLLDEAHGGTEATSSEEDNATSESNSLVEQGSVDPHETRTTHDLDPVTLQAESSQDSDSLQRSRDRSGNSKGKGKPDLSPKNTTATNAKISESSLKEKGLSQTEVSEQLQEIANAYRKATRARFSKALRPHQALKENRDLLCLGLDSGSSRTVTTLSSDDFGFNKTPRDSDLTSGLEESMDAESEVEYSTEG